MRRGLLFGGWLASLLGVAGVAHANLVLNGGFELNGGAGNQNPSAWINVNPDWNGGMSFAGLTAPESSWFAANGCVGPTCIGNPASNFLDQRLTTTPGAFYNLSFAFNPGANATATNTELAVSWDGTTVDIITGTQLPGWEVYTVDNLLATSSNTVLGFWGRQDPGFFGLDAVDVELTATPVPEPTSLMLLGTALPVPEPTSLMLLGTALPVPEPTSLMLLGTALAGLGLARRARARAQS